MSWFTSGIKMIFGVGQDGSNNIMDAAKGIGNFIDEQEFTKEERSVVMTDKVFPAMQTFMDNTVKENTERSKTRREIAIWIIRNWFIMLWVSILAYAIELFLGGSHKLSKFIFDIASLETMLYLVIGVGGFFFGAHIIRQFKGE